MVYYIYTVHEWNQGERRRMQRGATCWMLVYYIYIGGGSSEGLLVECWSTILYILYIYECSQGERRRKQRGATCWMLVYHISTNAVKERRGVSSEGLLVECWSTVYIRMQSRREADAARGYLLNAGLLYVYTNAVRERGGCSEGLLVECWSTGATCWMLVYHIYTKAAGLGTNVFK